MDIIDTFCFQPRVILSLRRCLLTRKIYRDLLWCWLALDTSSLKLQPAITSSNSIMQSLALQDRDEWDAWLHVEG